MFIKKGDGKILTVVKISEEDKKIIEEIENKKIIEEKKEKSN